MICLWLVDNTNTLIDYVTNIYFGVPGSQIFMRIFHFYCYKKQKKRKIYIYFISYSISEDEEPFKASSRVYFRRRLHYFQTATTRMNNTFFAGTDANNKLLRKVWEIYFPKIREVFKIYFLVLYSENTAIFFQSIKTQMNLNLHCWNRCK